MGACNCKESRPEQSSATLDPAIKRSVVQKEEEQPALRHEAVVDFENSQADPSKPPASESQDFYPSKPSLQSAPGEFHTDRSLDAQENPVNEPEALQPELQRLHCPASPLWKSTSL